MTAAGTDARELTLADACGEALTQLMDEDPKVFLAGNVGESAYGGFERLRAEQGDRRVIETPLSDQALVGLGIGAAASGLRPVVEVAHMDALCLAMDQIVNQAAKMAYLVGGRTALPLTILTTAGAGRSAAAQHSQSLEALLCHIPGLEVAYPAGPYDAKGLLVAGVRSDNPTVVIMSRRMLDGATGEVPPDLYEIPLGRSAVVRPGIHLTVVAVGRMVGEALAAAEVLAADGFDCEVIDPRTLQPLDVGPIVESVSRTNGAVVVHEAVRFGGIGAEIAAQVQEHAFDYLDVPVGRIGAPFSPVPFSPSLEARYVPDAARIEAELRQMLADGAGADR